MILANRSEKTLPARDWLIPAGSILFLVAPDTTPRAYLSAGQISTRRGNLCNAYQRNRLSVPDVI